MQSSNTANRSTEGRWVRIVFSHEERNVPRHPEAWQDVREIRKRTPNKYRIAVPRGVKRCAFQDRCNLHLPPPLKSINENVLLYKHNCLPCLKRTEKWPDKQ